MTEYMHEGKKRLGWPGYWWAKENFGETWHIITNDGPWALEEAKYVIADMVEGLTVELMYGIPTTPVRIFLMKDEESLARIHMQLFNEPLDTPYGFYDDVNRVIALNLDAGWGPLAHEITHPMLDADIPGAPPWLDEGLASLFEDSYSTEDGRRRGMPNWRIPTLKRVARTGEKGLLEVLYTNRTEFYSPPYDVNYALARGFLLYLQEVGALREVYEEMRARGAKTDPVLLLEDVFDARYPEIEGDFLMWVEDL